MKPIMSNNFDPDAIYDLYSIAEDGALALQPFYRIAERHFRNTVDKLPDGTYRRNTGIVILNRGPRNKVLASKHPEFEQLGVIEDGVFNRVDGQRFKLVKVG